MSKFLIISFFFIFISAKEFYNYKRYNLSEFEPLIKDKSYFLIDTRDYSKVVKGIIPNTIAISLKVRYNFTITSLIEKTDKIILISEKRKYRNSLLLTEKLGYKNIMGYFFIEEWKKELYQINEIKLNNTNLKNIKKEFELIDIREEEEHKKNGNIQNTINVPFSKIKNNLKNINKSKINYIMDTRGYKSAILITYLIREGYDINKLFNVKGGYYRMNLIKKPKKKEDL